MCDLSFVERAANSLMWRKQDLSRFGMHDCLFNDFGVLVDFVFGTLQAGSHDECDEKVVLTCVSHAVRSIRWNVYDLISLYGHWRFLVFDEDGSLSLNYVVDLFRIRVDVWVQSFTGLEHAKSYKLIFCSILCIRSYELNWASENHFGLRFFEFEDSYRHGCILV